MMWAVIAYTLKEAREGLKCLDFPGFCHNRSYNICLEASTVIYITRVSQENLFFIISNSSPDSIYFAVPVIRKPVHCTDQLSNFSLIQDFTKVVDFIEETDGLRQELIK